MGSPAKKTEGPSGIIPVQWTLDSPQWKKRVAKMAHAGKLPTHTPKAPDMSFLCDASKGNQNSKKANFVAGICRTKPAVAIGGSKTATTGTLKPSPSKPTPGMTAVFTRNGGFELVPFVKSQAEVTQKIAEGKLSPASHIAYRDNNGQVHTGTVIELNKILPKK
jgi:hypothetical protein